MKKSVLLVLGWVLVLAMGCGKKEENQNQSTPQSGETQSTSPTPLGHTTVPSGDQKDTTQVIEEQETKWLTGEDKNGVSVYVRVVHVKEGVLNTLDSKDNCIQAVQPREATGEWLGTVEFLAQPCRRGNTPVLTGPKEFAFSLAIRRQASKEEGEQEGKEEDKEDQEEPKNRLLSGKYDLYDTRDRAGEVLVGVIEFTKDAATITELCPEKECQVVYRNNRVYDLKLNERVIADLRSRQELEQLNETERSEREVDLVIKHARILQDQLETLKDKVNTAAVRKEKLDELSTQVKDLMEQLKDREATLAESNKKLGEVQKELTEIKKHDERAEEVVRQAEELVPPKGAPQTKEVKKKAEVKTQDEKEEVKVEEKKKAS